MTKWVWTRPAVLAALAALAATTGLVALVTTTACNNNSASPAAVTGTRATLQISVQPNPVTATRCSPQCTDRSGNGSFGLLATLAINVQESAGIGANITSLNLSGPAVSAFTPLTFSPDQIAQLAGASHISGNATLTIPITLAYNPPSGSANLALHITLQATDDRNNQVTATGQVTIM